MLKNVLRYIRELKLVRAGDRVAVAVSGGADSVALLRVLLELRAELGTVLAVAHFNHGLRGDESLADEAFVRELAKELKLESFVGRGDVREHASSNKLSIEAAGRELRYRWLVDVAAAQRFDAVATAHTLDDQAETVLLKFLRGAGTKGLAGIYPELLTADGKSVRIVRPLLGVTRQEVESYLSGLGQQWREDESNLDRRFTRNRLRHDLLPLLQREFNPHIRQVLTGTADIARAEEEYWTEVVEKELAARSGDSDPGGKAFPESASGFDAKEQIPRGLKPARDDKSNEHHLGVHHGAEAPLHSAQFRRVSQPADAVGGKRLNLARLSLNRFSPLPLALQRRVLKRFAEQQGFALDFEHVEKMQRCALGDLAQTELAGGWRARSSKGYLELLPPSPKPDSPSAYEYALTVPGELVVSELGVTLRALVVAEEFAREAPEGSLLRADLLGSDLTVRNWRPGDRFWPTHSKSEEKLKRLFAENRIPAEQRSTWPLVLKGTEIVWVKGFPVAKQYRWWGDGDAVMIEQQSAEKP